MFVRRKKYTKFSVYKKPRSHWKRLSVFAAIAFLIAIPTVVFTVNKKRAEAIPCPCNVLPANPTPQATDGNGGVSLEVGFKFRSAIDGYITGVRFYKVNGAGMTGTHTGSLWDNLGNRIATGTFQSETASGWQQVNFSSPVAITANTIYTASTFMTNGTYAYTLNYFLNHDEVNYPLTAPRSGQANDGFGTGGQGVTNLSGSSAYPNQTFNNANYWVDVAFTGAPDSDPPAVTANYPANNATSVNIGDTMTATFDIHMDSNTLTTNTFTVKDDQNNNVAGTVSYNVASKTASFVSTGPLAVNKTYTATLEGGTGTVVTSLDGIALASDYSWSFTTAATDPCPCSLKDRTAPAGSSTFDETAGLEVGIKITPQANGYINALRFYKPIITTETTHTGKIWDSSGAQLASVTFSNESEYGWQEAKLSSPLAVTKGQLLIVSYGTTEGIYQATAGALTSTNITADSLTAYADNNSLNAATGSNNRNGVFGSTVGSYPNQGSTNGSYYWIDAVFSVNSGTVKPLQPTVVQPTNNSYGVKADQLISAHFPRALNSGTVSGSTVQVFDSSNNQVAGTASYVSAEHAITFDPTGNLTSGEKYTVKLAASIADTNGATLGSEYQWSFTVGTALGSDPNAGPGGPILLITSSDKYSKYYAEILRTEGLNYFATADIGTVNTSMLANYDAAVLAETTLTQPQADMFTTWVNSGGNLIAMRPDKKLASLLGLTDASSTRTNQYMLVNTASAPGTGIVNQTIQFKGTADNYTLNGATSVASFYSDASTSTANPAATTRSVGSSGGTAAAFTYDLAKSVIALHQGNQAWVGQDRDGQVPIRTNDLFFGAMTGDVQPDWVDLNKIAIPQADEQQRLLANIITEVTKDKKPLPRFWYLPADKKAAVIMAGDDHGEPNATGTERVISNWLNESTTGCSTLDWQCVRASHYVYDTAALTNARAVQYNRLGYEIGDHVSNGKGCINYTSFANLTSIFTSDLNTWRAKYTGVPNQATNRLHCYLWSDWDSVPRVGLNNGIRFSMEYVAYPGSWINGRAPMMTGSGMTMRLTDADGDLLDYYQGVTNLDDTSANSTSINALFDNATGSAGYYGMFGTHYGMGDTYQNTIYAAAKSRNIPIISSAEALTWLDGHGSSTFSSFTGSSGQFGFTINAAQGAVGLKAMLPINDASGALSDLKLGGQVVTYQTQTVKGVSYAVFNAQPGAYTATYSDYDPNPSNPGGGNNGGGNSDSSSGQSSTGSSGSTSKKSTKKNGGLFANNNTEDLTNLTPGITPPSGEPSQPTESLPGTSQPKEKEFVTPTREDTGNAWIPWLVGISLVVLIGGGFWFVIGRKRHQNNTPTW